MSWRRREIKDDTVETGTPEETIHQKKRPQPKWDDLFDHSRTQWTHRSRVHWWMDGAGAGLFLFLFFSISLSLFLSCVSTRVTAITEMVFSFFYFFFWPALSALSQRRGHISSGECRRRRAHLWRADALRARRAPTVLFSGIIIIILILILIIIIILIFLSLCLGSPLAFYPLSFFVTIYCCIEV